MNNINIIQVQQDSYTKIVQFNRRNKNSTITGNNTYIIVHILNLSKGLQKLLKDTSLQNSITSYVGIKF